MDQSQNLTNKDKFLRCYARHLSDCIREFPKKYKFKIHDIPKVVRNIMDNIENGNYNYANSEPMIRTCREFNISCDKNAVDQYLKNIV